MGEGAPIRREASEKKLVVSLHFFGSESTISRFDERFRDGQYSLFSFLFAVLLSMPHAQLFVKVGHVPPCPMESAPLKISQI